MRLRKKAMPATAIMSPERVLIMTYVWILMATAYAVAVAQAVATPRHREDLGKVFHMVFMTSPGRGKEKMNRKTMKTVNTFTVPSLYSMRCQPLVPQVLKYLT
jgi:hypothetical protein